MAEILTPRIESISDPRSGPQDQQAQKHPPKVAPAEKQASPPVPQIGAAEEEDKHNLDEMA
jgi:hypothetical protein